MNTAATAALVAAKSLATATERARALGLPSTLFDFTPEQKGYWFEPGLPWLTSEMRADPEKMPLSYRGHRVLLSIGYMGGDNMAPRFPKGCGVQTMPVCDKDKLIVGRVYTYRYQNQKSKEWEWEIGRLMKIEGNYLEVKADNNPTPSIWLLRDEEREAAWDVWEVTHYVSYPSEHMATEKEVASA
jgi:hypothetical protein